MPVHTHKILLTLAAAILVATLAAGCGETLTGPGQRVTSTVQAALVESAPVEITFAAVVSAVTDSNMLLQGRISVGDSVSGSVLYDEFAADLDHKPDRGRYLSETPPFMMKAGIGALHFESDPIAPALTIRLDNADPADKKRDSARFSSAANLDVVPGVGVADMTIFLTDITAAALSSDALAGTDPYHADWPTKRQFTITGTEGWQVVTEIVSIVDSGDEELNDTPANNSKIKFHQD